jgi:copper homeostasis protein
VPTPANATVLVEVAVDGVAGALAAVAAGAHRLEACACLERGGVTPSAGMVAALTANVTVPVFAMVRPRGGDFRFDRFELDAMLRDVEALRAAGASGIVTGVLHADGTIDRERMRALCDAAAPLPVTCHRAFDLCADLERELDVLCALGVARVLTSGGAASAVAGAATLARLVRRAGDRIAVMAGAGVRDTNVRELVAATGVREVHLSATAWQPGAMAFRRAGVPMGAVAPADDYTVRVTDGALVARVVDAVRDV